MRAQVRPLPTQAELSAILSYDAATGELRADNKSGVKGVCWDAYHQKWAAYISIGARQRKLGRFEEFADAVSAVEAERENLHGEYARAA